LWLTHCAASKAPSAGRRALVAQDRAAVHVGRQVALLDPAHAVGGGWRGGEGGVGSCARGLSSIESIAGSSRGCPESLLHLPLFWVEKLRLPLHPRRHCPCRIVQSDQLRQQGRQPRLEGRRQHPWRRSRPEGRLPLRLPLRRPWRRSRPRGRPPQALPMAAEPPGGAAAVAAAAAAAMAAKPPEGAAAAGAAHGGGAARRGGCRCGCRCGGHGGEAARGGGRRRRCPWRRTTYSRGVLLQVLPTAASRTPAGKAGKRVF
jgi:hypothetical protein